MKIRKLIGNALAVSFLLWGAVETAFAQEQKKPLPLRIQTSARPERTAVYKTKGAAGGQEASKQKPAATAAKQTSPATSAQPKSAAGSKRGSAAKAAPKNTGGGRYVALKTNLAYDAFALMNLGVEVQVQERLTLEVPLMWSLWDYEQEHGLRTVALQPELRWWTGKQTGRGHYLGVHAHVAWFNLKWDEDRYQDCGRPLLGAGLGYGYKLPLSEHWGAEFNLGVGYANMKYDTYYNVANGARLDTRVRHYWGLTRLSLALAYKF